MKTTQIIPNGRPGSATCLSLVASALPFSSNNCCTVKARALVSMLLFSTALTLGVTLGAAAEEPPLGGSNGTAAAPTDVSQISGTWNGVSFAYPELFAIKLELQTDAMGGLTGQLQYSPAHPSRQLFNNSKGSYKVTGKYDAASRTFYLKPGAWVDRDQAGTGNPSPTAGILDARTGELAGLGVNNNPLLPVMMVLARDDAGSNLIEHAVKSGIANDRFRPPPSPEQLAAREAQQAHAAKMAEQRAARRQPRSGAATNKTATGGNDAASGDETAETAPADEPTQYQPPTLDQIVAWASRIKQEKPDLDVGGSTGEQVYLLARNLFADDSFKPTFGTTYDQLTQTQRYVILRLLHKNGNELRSNGNGVVTLLDRPFMYVGTGSAAEMTVVVLWQRPVRGWVENMESSMTQMSGEASDFDNIATMESQVKTSVALLWPSESAKFTKLIADTRTRLAVPILEASAVSTIASASGIEGVRSLTGWMTRQKKLLQYAPADEQAKLQKRLDAKVDELLEGLVAQDIRAIPNLGRGLEAVNAGNKWYGQLVQNYGFAIHRPLLVHAIGMLQARRADDLAEAGPAILADVGKQTTEDDLNAPAQKYFQVPGDDSTKTARQVQNLVGQRMAQFQRDKYMALFSAHERQWLKQDGTFAPPNPLPQPDADDLRVAVLRTMCRMGGKRVSANTIHYSNNPIATTMGIYVIMTLDHVDELSCTRDPGGFKVDYRLHASFEMSKNISGIMNSDDSLGSSMLRGMMDSVNGPSGMQSGRFEFSDQGWWCPTMLERPVEVLIIH
jgi:hypothetical protein